MIFSLAFVIWQSGNYAICLGGRGWNLQNYPITKLPNSLLCLLELRVALHQFLQTEARELYRNLGVFPIPFALIDRSFSVFRMLDFLARTESASAGRLLGHQFWN